MQTTEDVLVNHSPYLNPIKSLGDFLVNTVFHHHHQIIKTPDEEISLGKKWCSSVLRNYKIVWYTTDVMVACEGPTPH